MKLLLDSGAHIGATTDTKDTALHLATREGHTEVVKVLLERGAQVGAMTDDKHTALHLACAAQSRLDVDRVEVVKLLLGSGAHTGATTDTKDTALQLAAISGHLSVVKLLLDRGAAIDATNDEGRTALNVVCADIWWALGIEIVCARTVRERQYNSRYFMSLIMTNRATLHCIMQLQLS